MKIEITEDAVLLLELSEGDRSHLEFLLRRAGGTSIIIPRRATAAAPLSDQEELEAMIESIRTSAQDTVAALRRRGYRIARRTGA